MTSATSSFIPNDPYRLWGEVSSDPISNGQGEFLVFRQNPCGKLETLTYEVFSSVYEILNRYSVTSIASKLPHQAEKRDLLIKQQIKQIDPELHVAFIPKTLYELLFIKELIEEDAQSAEFFYRKFDFRNPNAPLLDPLDKKFAEWESLSDTVNAIKFLGVKERLLPESANYCPHVTLLAYKINAIAVNTLVPSPLGFSFSDIMWHTDTLFKYFEWHYKMGLAGDLGDVQERDIKLDTPEDNFFQTLLATFARSESVEDKRQSCLSRLLKMFETPSPVHLCRKSCLAINSEEQTTIIKKVIMLECSPLARTHIIIYRGGSLEEDTVMRSSGEIHSLSFGSGLFSGAVLDPTAAAWTFIRPVSKDGYAIPIPIDQLDKSPFHLPPTNTVVQLVSGGEMFHPRTKIPSDVLLTTVEGLAFHNLLNSKTSQGKKSSKPGELNTQLLDSLRSSYSAQELTTLFGAYKERSINLKTIDL